VEAEGECGLGGEGKVTDPNARVQAPLFTSLKNVQSRAQGVSGGYYSIINVIHLLTAHHRDAAHHGNHWKIKYIF